jgi:excisionase family DNA binding protein
MAMIGTSEAARRLGISGRRVAAMILQGLLRAQKVGKTWIIDETDVAKLGKSERKAGRPPKK